MMQLGLPIPDTVDEQVAAIDAQIAELRAKRDAVQRSRLLTCYHCNQQTVISSLTYIQTHWYVRPHGCSGGDYWLPGEGRFKCPHCDKINRLLRTGEKNPFIIRDGKHAGVDQLKLYFAEVVDVHEH